MQWDDAGTVLNNYRTFGVVSNPNLLGVRSRTSHKVENESLQLPLPADACDVVSEFDAIDSGSDLEEDGICYLYFLPSVCFFSLCVFVL